MGSTNTIATLTSWIINEFTGLTTDNCKAMDESVFDYIQTTDGAPDYCVVVDPGGFLALNEREFRSSSINWRYFINYYHEIYNDGNYMDSYNNGLQFIDDLILKVSRDPTLGRTVLIASVQAGGTPIPYARGAHRYVMHDVEIRILENIS